MSKDEVKKEIEYLRNKQSNYGWREGDAEKFDKLQKMWDNFAHVNNHKYVKPPVI